MTNVIRNFLSISRADGNNILFMFLAALIAGGLCVLLYYLIRHNRKVTETRTISKLLEDTGVFKERVSVKLNNRLGTKYYVIHIEINKGQKLKDTFGEIQYNHAVQVLIKRYEKIFAKDFEICKVDEENFYLAIKGNLSDKQIVDYGNYIIMETKSPMILAGGLKVELGSNVAICSSEFSTEYDKIMAKLTTAMILSKKKGINQCVIYGENLESMETAEYKNYIEIKEAIEKKEFTLFYQKMVSLDTMKTFGYEGLLRWNHKDLGVLSPEKFLQTLEQSGDMNWVGEWGFEKILALEEKLKVKYPIEHIILSYNLSMQQMLYAKIADDYRRASKHYRISSEDICFEVDQATLLENNETIKNNMESLRTAGFLLLIDNLSVDRFNLSQLSDVKPNMIKLDFKFLPRAMEDETVSKMLDLLVSHCKKNDIKIIASGIETQEMLEYANEKGIDIGQGYLFARPKSADEL